MPVGPSYREGCNPRRMLSVGSCAVPVTRTGRVWGTSARRAPSVRTSSTPIVRATSTTRSENVRQRSCGSAPRRNTTSRPLGPRGADANRVSGHSMARTPPRSSRTSGRVAVKSKNSSASMVANGSAPQRRAR